eukprot:2921139-Pyramimonas_sp.AAC.1
MGAAGACERWHLGLRWGSLWNPKPCEGCATMGAPQWVRWARANAGTRAFGRVPLGPRNVRGVF